MLRKKLIGPHPIARTDGLIEQELGDEILIYDLERHHATCLNHHAATVWKLCDGSNSVSDITEKLIQRINNDFADSDAKQVGVKTVCLALEKLSSARLLQPGFYPTNPAAPKSSRREFIRGMTAGSLPVVTGIIVPTAAQAASCLAVGEPCVVDSDCCSGFCWWNGSCRQQWGGP